MKLKEKKFDLGKILFNLYLFLFIFTMINREFLFFGVDIRYINILLGGITVIYSIVKKNYKDSKLIYYDKNIVLVLILYIWSLISNISWLWNGLNINKTRMINENILLLNNLLAIVVIFFNRKYINKINISKIIVIACTVLFFSVILLELGYSIESISGSSDVNCIYRTPQNGANHINIFGGKYRIGGYAQDPNYASLFFIIGMISVLQLNIKKIIKVPFMIIFLIGLGYACSKTLICAAILGLIFLIIRNRIKNDTIKKNINILLIVCTIFAFFIVFRIDIIKDKLPQTLTTRFSMWDKANELFLRNPILGNGITSFRSYFAEQKWYVHCHSTYWQVLSELGLVGAILFFNIIFNLLESKNKYNQYLGFVYIIFALTYETMALQIAVYILCLSQINKQEDIKYGKRALFIVNTLSNGGAERVCVNLAEELIEENYEVDFIVLGNNNDNEEKYNINSKINIYNLGINSNNKILKLFQIINAQKKVDKFILNREEDEKYCLITSHLPMANLLTRMSIIRDRAIYVFHTKTSSYDNLPSKKIFKMMFNFMYANKKIVAVSEGVRQEAINKYGIKEYNIKTIYNPLNIDVINKNKDEKIVDYGKYILHVGRFNRAKRQDRMLEIYKRGEFYKDYKLLFCGTGELEEEIHRKVQELNLEEYVVFLGWQSNVFKWINNAEILVITSDYEAFPVTLIEAIACNTKIVSSDCEFGPREILLNEYSKYLVDTNNIDEYVQKIREALKDYPSTVNPIIEKCSASHIVEEYINFMK